MTYSYRFSCTFSVFAVLWRIHPTSAAISCPSESCVLSQVSLLSSWALQSASIPDALCHKDGDCPAGEAVVAGNGKWESLLCCCWWRQVPLEASAGLQPQRSLMTESGEDFLCFMTFY